MSITSLSCRVYVSNAGDVNGDGLDDLFIGKAYVVFGKTDGTAVNLSAISAGTGGFAITGGGAFGISGAGDVNGDGLADLLTTDPSGSGGAGTTYVVYGKTDTTTVNIANVIAGTGGYAINGAESDDQTGQTVSGAGDVNGDGLADLILGARVSGDVRHAYVVFGKTDSTAINLSAVITGSGGFVINTLSASDREGSTVSGAGDVNGDGLADLIMGSVAALGSSGRSYVLFGKADGTPINLSAVIAGTGGFAIDREVSSDSSNNRVSSAGDVNGDGLADLIVSAFSGNGGAGKAFVVFGKTDTAKVNLGTVAAGSGGFAINGGIAGEKAGYAVSSAGDVNGDGLSDLIIGTPTANSNAGKNYVVYGKADTTAVNLNSVAAGVGGFVINSTDPNNQSGSFVSNAGDVNGDGLADLLVGSSANSVITKSYLIFGGTQFATTVDFMGSSSPDLQTGTSASETFAGGAGNDTITGNGGADVMYGGMGNDTFN